MKRDEKGLLVAIELVLAHLIDSKESRVFPFSNWKLRILLLFEISNNVGTPCTMMVCSLLSILRWMLRLSIHTSAATETWSA